MPPENQPISSSVAGCNSAEHQHARCNAQHRRDVSITGGMGACCLLMCTLQSHFATHKKRSASRTYTTILRRYMQQQRIHTQQKTNTHLTVGEVDVLRQPKRVEPEVARHGPV